MGKLTAISRSNTPQGATNVREFKDIRQRKFRQQAAFAEVLGVTQTTASRYELGVIVPAKEMRRKIARLLGVAEARLWPALKRSAAA